MPTLPVSPSWPGPVGLADLSSFAEADLDEPLWPLLPASLPLSSDLWPEGLDVVGLPEGLPVGWPEG